MAQCGKSRSLRSPQLFDTARQNDLAKCHSKSHSVIVAIGQLAKQHHFNTDLNLLVCVVWFYPLWSSLTRTVQAALSVFNFGQIHEVKFHLLIKLWPSRNSKMPEKQHSDSDT